MIELIATDFEQWRSCARRAYAAGIAPHEIRWRTDAAQDSLFTESPLPDIPASLRMPARFLAVAQLVSRHDSAERWDLLYRALWRIAHGERDLLNVVTDDITSALLALRHEVLRDVHKMHAFVRFRRMPGVQDEEYAAWYEPRFDIVDLAAPFFAKRFSSTRWSIFSPRRSAHWDGTKLSYSSGIPMPVHLADDELEPLWREYYQSTFNPARLNLRAMQAHIPPHYRRQLPELQSLAPMLDEAPARLAAMLGGGRSAPSAQPFVPVERDLATLRDAARACAGCALHACATRTVFGEGAARAAIMLVGEQPGDAEDLAGRPFVGPAGEILDGALHEAALDRGALFVTNAVKHFSFTERGTRRIHRTPRLSEIIACRPWLEAEIEAVCPRVVVCLGATAARSVLGPQFRLSESRGQLLRSPLAAQVVATFHPSAVLRATDPQRRESLRAALVEDLRLARSVAEVC